MSKAKRKYLRHRGPTWEPLKKARTRANVRLNKIKHIEKAIISASPDQKLFLISRLEHWRMV